MTITVAFSAIEISPTRFAAFSDHGKSEFCRLLLERGIRLDELSEMCGVSSTDARLIADQRHSFVVGEQPTNAALAGNIEVAPAPQHPTEKQKDVILERLNAQCCRMLLRLPPMGPAYWKNSAEMERDIGLPSGNGMRVVNILYENRLIERRRAKRGCEQAWALTTLGGDLRNAIDEGEAPAIAKAK